MVWKITPAFAEWIVSNNNPFRTEGILSPLCTVVELGCGVSGIVALALSPSVGVYVATDQGYVRKLFLENVNENRRHTNRNKGGGRSNKAKKNKDATDIDDNNNVSFEELDWETDIPSSSLKNDTDPGFDILISCDCIYNEALTKPFLSTCAEICRLRPLCSAPEHDDDPRRPTICLIAQRLRSPDVFETWLREALVDFRFRVWRVRDFILPDSLKEDSGSVVHVLLLT